MLRYGYVSNGFADHTVDQMAQVLRSFGYEGLGLTLGHPHLEPSRARRSRLRELRDLLAAKRLEPVVETGARYVLDPFRKHRPSLVSVDRAGRDQRGAFYRRAIDVAHELGGSVVSLWSGNAQAGIPPETSWGRLIEGLRPVLDHAASRGIRIGFEPEPGMFVEDLAGWVELKSRLAHPALGLTIDVGHLAVTESQPWESHLETHAADLVNVHLDDARDRRHEHLPFGEGEIPWPAVLGTLERIGYRGLALVELSRHSHVAPLMAQRSILYLRAAEARGGDPAGHGRSTEEPRARG